MLTPALTQARVMVIDDHPANLLLVRRILGQAGFAHVRGYKDSRSALENWRSWDPDVILLDLHMPHLDGVAFLEALRRSIPDNEFVPVLMLTADTSGLALKQSLAAGANDFATKPIDAVELLLRVRNLLAIRLCYRELKQHNATLAAALQVYSSSDEKSAATRAGKIAAIEHVITSGGPRMVFQPVVDIETGCAIGVEALARFDGEPSRTPDVWFSEAAACGLAAELELAAIGAALRAIDHLPAGQFMAVNVSPTTLCSREFGDSLGEWPADRLVLELTEHHVVDDYDLLNRSVTRLRGRGIRFAVDDTGAGFASLTHIVKLAPDIIKLDRQITRNVDNDPAKRALAAALVRFGADVGASITAEGIETSEELQVVRDTRSAIRAGLLPRPARSARRSRDRHAGRRPSVRYVRER